MRSKKILTALLLTGVFAAASCGDDQPQFIKDIIYDVRDNLVSLDIEFSSEMTLNTELVVPILKYGSVHLSPGNTERGVRIGLSLNMDALGDSNVIHLERTRLLPNGEPMSPYVKTDLARLRYQASNQIAVSAYLGLVPQEFYLGTSVELGFLDANFPSGLVISQRVNDLKKRPLGVITLYGPKVKDGAVIASGGFFFIANITDLAKYGEEDKKQKPTFIPNTGLMARNTLSQPDETYVNQDKYRSKDMMYRLFKLYQHKGREAGLVD